MNFISGEEDKKRGLGGEKEIHTTKKSCAKVRETVWTLRRLRDGILNRGQMFAAAEGRRTKFRPQDRANRS